MRDPKFSYTPSNVLQCINFDEFENLNKEDKSVVQLILGCNIIDLTENSESRNKLLELFPEGTETYTKLMNLIYVDESE